MNKRQENKRKIRRRVKIHKWKVMYANVRGLKSKKASMIDILEEVKPDVVLLCETQLKSNVGMRFQGYLFFGRSRLEKSGGGVAILVKEELKNIFSVHTSERNIEILWVSATRTDKKPIYFGVYYGRQESRVNKEEIEEEVDLLQEEIMEIQNEGEMLLAMDANGKIGILGEEPSRNGKLLQKVFEETEMKILNKSDVCTGKVTRQNTKNMNEKSAIDLVVSSMGLESGIKSMVIDEAGDFKIQGKSESDHNTIIVDMDISHIRREKKGKKTKWRLNAPEEKWIAFRQKLNAAQIQIERIMANGSDNVTVKYAKWKSKIDSIALQTIGKTTVKGQMKEKFSQDVKNLRGERRLLRGKIKNETDILRKSILKQRYSEKQTEVKTAMENERKIRMGKKFQHMMDDPTGQRFWKERRSMNRNDAEEMFVTKDDEGIRIHEAQRNQENVAKYYEKLYQRPAYDNHPYHDVIAERMRQYEADVSYDWEVVNQKPEKLEIEEAIKNKKNGKSTTDLKNEILKGGGTEMVDMIKPLMDYFWDNETVPEQWNEGNITTLWKGKGDREKLSNHRGITISSSISMIAEEILNNRVLSTMKFTQAQGGGKKGGATSDHLFILKSIIEYAMKMRKRIFLTFYDVQKAYDRVEVDDMMVVLWEQGVRGRIWRLIRCLNQNLTARVKTRHGYTRRIMREVGAKQGGKLIVPMFAKLTDTLAEDMEKDDRMGVTIEGKEINCLLWVDDVMTVAEGKPQQEATLGVVHEFGKKHRLKWGIDKCAVMEAGNHREVKESWKMGNEEVKHRTSYKYLGEIVSRNGKNQENIEERSKKVKTSTKCITTISKQEIMRKIEVNTTLKLHETITIPILLHNAETWKLTKTEELKLERIELWSLKRILNLPRTTPSAAVRFVSGTLLTKVRIDMKQLIYLQKILSSQEGSWTKHFLMVLDQLKTGWALNIRNKLDEYGLPNNWDGIEATRSGLWKLKVKVAGEKRNRQILLEDCFKRVAGGETEKTKTKSIVPLLQDELYIRKPVYAICFLDKLRAKTVIMARFGMLACKNNYRHQYGSQMCEVCKTVDDEQHRINMCVIWRTVNRYDSNDKVDFADVYRDECDILFDISTVILSVWNLQNGKNEIRGSEPGVQ